jgi:hypothetical protein
MVRKALSGHVTGGWCYGYRNIDVSGTDGKRVRNPTVDRVWLCLIALAFVVMATSHTSAISNTERNRETQRHSEHNLQRTAGSLPVRPIALMQ